MYPKELPTAALQALIKALLNGERNPQLIAKSIYDITGYVLGQALGEPSESAPLITQVDLQQLQAQVGLVQLNPTWQIVIAHLIQLAIALLNKEKA